MPVDKTRYPVNWNEISQRIRQRANNCCETCGVANGAQIVRSSVNAADYLLYDADKDWYMRPDRTPIKLSELPDEFLHFKHTRVVLTVHHIGVDYPGGRKGDPHDKMDCRDENLIALCQRCHLLADMPTHVANAKRTRLSKKRKQEMNNGQLELF